MSETQNPTSEADLQRIAATCLAGRGEDIVALDVRGLVEYMDFLLLVTGSSPRRNRAIAQNVVKQMKGQSQLPISRSGMDSGEWICLDFVDVVLHLFDRETRHHYDLELLWADAPRFELDLPTAPVAAGADEDEPVEPGVILPPREE